MNKLSQEAYMYMANFHNMLTPGQEPKMTKEYKPIVANKMDTILTPDSLKLHVLKSEKVRKLIELYAKQTNKPKKQVKQMVYDIIQEIGLARNLTVIRACGVLINAVAKRISSGIYVNEANLNRIKSGLGKNPVLYLPSHRSYLDFILMSYVCFHYDIEIPGIAAGMDFHSMVGMGTILRKTGAFFMRRSFTNDDTYWDIFKEYMYALVKDYHTGVEFFIEGTRSRNFKALSPKIGLLTMALQPYINGDVFDITIVPVSVSYEKVLEESLFVYELLGVPKPKESTKGFLKALKIVEKRFGRMYMDFGDPISVKQYFANDIDRIRHASFSSDIQKLNKHEISLIKSLANEIVYLQQRRIVITTFNMVALYYSFFSNTEGNLKLDRLCKGVSFLKEMIEYLDGHVATNSNAIKIEIIECIEIHSNILKFINGSIELSPTQIQMEGIDIKRLKGYLLSKEIMENAVQSITLQIYINPCMFWLSTPALLLLTALKLVKQGTENLTIALLKENMNELNLLFSHEFLFDLQRQEADYTKNLKFLEKFDVFIINDFKILIKKNERSDLLLCAIAPFVCIYYQLIVTILELPNKEISSKEILVATQKRVEHLLSTPNSLYVHPYCLALDNLNVALQSFVQNGYITKNKDESNMFTCIRNKLNSIRILLLQYCELLVFPKLCNKTSKLVLAKL